MVNITLKKANVAHFGNYCKQQVNSYLLMDIVDNAGR